MILIDSDLAIDLFRGLPTAKAWFSTLSRDNLIVPGFVAMELVQGCGTKDKLRQVEEFLAETVVIWPAEETCRHALSLLSKLRLSTGIGIIDALIAQMALTLELPLHTFNSKHYASVPGLRLVQPYVR
ncbi:MAG: PIN domain-containing protein [Phycisphaerae bacterium]